MVSNFDFLNEDPQFSAFAKTAIAAEDVFGIDPSLTAVNCRRTAEYAVKWMYTAEKSLRGIDISQMQFVNLINTDEFREIVGDDLYTRIDFIRKIGNNAVHNSRPVSEKYALIALQDLHAFMDFICCMYGSSYHMTFFDKDLLYRNAGTITEKPNAEDEKERYEALMENIRNLQNENTALKDELTQRRLTRKESYIPKPIDMSEAETRKAYIDVMLIDAGWTLEKDC